MPGLSIVWVPRLSLKILGPKLAKFFQNMLHWAHIGLAGSLGGLLVGWLVAVARGLYLYDTYLLHVCYVSH